MEIRFRLPPCAASPLSRLDARWRLAGLLLACVAVCLLRAPWPASAALALACLLAWLAAVPPGWLLARLAVLGAVLAACSLPLPLLGSATWADAWVILARGLALALLAAVLVTSAPVDATLRAAGAVGLPALLVRVLLLAWRYLFLIGDELQRLRTALRVRGFRNRADAHSWGTVAAATGTLLVRGADRAERVAAAMRCRGMGAPMRELDERRTTLADVAFVVLTLTAGAALVGWDRT